ncbi:hypothetical protein [Halorarius halobius]|uniref:hypothetical protein n=1 Tax=Halorarius halobius TaxID=2962671 RepID=UPI0020CE591C|nr:hypothetical protein [Halorarius halobius]
MATRPDRIVLLALYQFSLLLGVLLFPVALAASRVGVKLPFDRVIAGLDAALERTE